MLPLFPETDPGQATKLANEHLTTHAIFFFNNYTGGVSPFGLYRNPYE